MKIVNQGADCRCFFLKIIEGLYQAVAIKKKKLYLNLGHTHEVLV